MTNAQHQDQGICLSIILISGCLYVQIDMMVSFDHKIY